MEIQILSHRLEMQVRAREVNWRREWLQGRLIDRLEKELARARSRFTLGGYSLEPR